MTEVEPRRGVVVGGFGDVGDVLARLLSLGASLRRGVLKLALAGVAAAAVIGYALLRDGLSDEAGGAILTVLGSIVVAAPPLVLGAFWLVLGELLELPERIRQMPVATRTQAEELRRAVREARSRRKSSSLPRRIWRLMRLSASSRELLTPYAPILPLLSPPFLAAVVLSAAATAAEVVAALVLLLVFALG